MAVGTVTRASFLAAGFALMAFGPTQAQELPPDPVGVWSLQDENASISTASLTDRYYTNGLQLGYVTGTDGVPGFLTGVARDLWAGGQVRFGINLTQQIFTPRDTAAPAVPPGDRPYAGTLLGTFFLQRDTPDSRSLIGLGLGWVGPAAGGEQIQNGFHDLIGQAKVNGWSSQLKNEPLFELTSTRTYRIPTGTVFGLETDALPNLGVGLGNLRIYAETGAQIRIGQGLDSDYGAPRLFPASTGGTVFRPTRPFAWYVFLGADGQGVAHDLTLNGNMWHNSPNVKLIPYMGEIEAGLTIMAFGARLTYTQVAQTQEFKHQKGGIGTRQ